MKITIGIKALNEQTHIATAITSALAAARRLGGEVVLADCGSSDDTIAIAKRYPIRIVQLAEPSERSCGAGAQLAYQFNRGEFFYLLDGDMILDPEFLPEGVAFLEQNPQFAGVGGLVKEVNTEALEFQIRAKTVQSETNWRPGTVDRLDCGGLYRSKALAELGYFADKNLHAFEEYELGARLRQKGWLLARIDKHAVDHFGHQAEGLSLLWRRIKSGHSSAAGEVVRASFGRQHFPVVASSFTHLHHGFTVWCWWASLIIVGVVRMPIEMKLLALVVLVVAPFTVLAVRRRSIGLGLYSLLVWNVSAIGLIAGFFRGRRPPEHPLKSVLLADNS